MTTYKPGDVVYVKTTGEVAYVLGTKPMDSGEKETTKDVDFEAFSGDVVTLRVPVLTKNEGIKHEIRRYLVEEVETLREKFERELADGRLAQEFQNKANATNVKIEELPKVRIN